jgi:cytochrome c556
MSSVVTPTTSRAQRAGRFVRPAISAALLVALLGLTATVVAQQPASQYPIFTQDHFTATMKTVGQNFGGVNQAVSAGDFENAKSRAIRAREQLATTVTFWRKNKKDDAVAMLRAATQRLDELDNVLSKTPIDKDAATAAVKQIGGACQACHAVYREQDPTTKAYKFKSNALQ